MKSAYLIPLAILLIHCGGKKETTSSPHDSVAAVKQNQPEPAKFLVIRGKDIWVRDAPTTGKVVMKLNTGDRCVVLEKGAYQFIRGHGDYWYKIDFNNQQGWVFGSQSDLRSAARTDWEKNDIHGNVRKMKWDDSEYLFDANGKLLEVNSTFQNIGATGVVLGTYSVHVRYRYNDADQLVLFVEDQSESEMGYVDSTFYAYDESGKVKEERIRGDGNEMIHSFVYAQNDTGGDNKIQVDNGKSVLVEGFDSKGNSIALYENGKVRKEMRYDELGNLTSEDIYYKDKLNFTYVYVYNDQGLQTEKRVKYYDGKSPESVLNTYQYELDKNGCWTKRTNIDSNGSRSTSTRKFEYY